MQTKVQTSQAGGAQAVQTLVEIIEGRVSAFRGAFSIIYVEMDVARVQRSKSSSEYDSEESDYDKKQREKVQKIAVFTVVLAPQLQLAFTRLETRLKPGP